MAIQALLNNVTGRVIRVDEPLASRLLTLPEFELTSDPGSPPEIQFVTQDQLDASYYYDTIYRVPIIPQLRQIPVVVYGHSLVQPTATWHSTNAHWTDRWATHTGVLSMTRRGVGGSLIEDTTLLMTGAGGSRWGPGATKTLAIVQAVINSAATQTYGEAHSVASMRRAMTHLIVSACCDPYDFTNAAWVFSTGGGAWTDQGHSTGIVSATYPAGAYRFTANDPATATFTVPAGISNKQVWIEHLVFAPNVAEPVIQVLRNGVEVFNGAVGTADLASNLFSKKMLPVGACNTGDVIQIEKIGGTTLFWLAGAYIDNGRNHVLAIGDHDNADNPSEPFASQIAAHNPAIDGAVADVNALMSNAASFLDLRGDLTHKASMLWSGDGGHPNDEGQAWYAAVLADGARQVIPWTSRLHTV
jgi:hypothetical protein